MNNSTTKDADHHVSLMTDQATATTAPAISMLMTDGFSKRTLFPEISQPTVHRHTYPMMDPIIPSSSRTPSPPPLGFKLNTGESNTNNRTMTNTLSETPGSPVIKNCHNLTLTDLKQRFDRPFAEVAKEFKICKGMMKTICLQLGIERWPYRQVRSMARMIDSINENIARCASDSCEKRRYELQLEKMLEQYHTFYLDFPNQQPASALGTLEDDEDDESLGALSPSTLKGTDTAEKMEDSTLSGHCGNIPSPVESLLFLKWSQPVTGCKKIGEPWTVTEQSALLEGIRRYGKDWKRIAKVVGSRSPIQVLNHAQNYISPIQNRTSSGLSTVGILSNSKRKRKAPSVPFHPSTASLKESKIIKKAWL